MQTRIHFVMKMFGHIIVSLSSVPSSRKFARAGIARAVRVFAADKPMMNSTSLYLWKDKSAAAAVASNLIGCAHGVSGRKQI